MESSLRRTEKTYSRLILVLLLGLVFVVTFCWAGYQVYTRWQEHRYMHQAHAAFDKDDLRWAALGARCAFEWRSDSLDACRLLGEIGDRQMTNEAIDWRRRAIDIAPDSIPDLVKLAETALRFGRLQLADQTLARVLPEKQRDPVYQTAAANVALARNDSAGALKHFTEAARLAPDDVQRQLALAEFELHSEDSARREHGRKLANQLRTNPKARASALEILLVDALRSARPGEGIALARELSAMPEAPFTDRLHALTAFRLFNDSDFVNALGRLQTEAHDSVGKAVALVNWMNSQKLALLAIDWSRRLPDTVLNTLAMHAALADSFIVMRDWRALANLLKTGSWTSAESLRFALQAKVARETGDDASHEKNWTMAVEKAGSDRIET
jgi:cytochrome c-type biogenesis protein CcmH/NrfG